LVDQDIIKIIQDNPICDEILKDFMHHGLEGGWTVGKAKIHDQWHKRTLICLECSLPLITLSDTHIIVSPAYIELCEVAHTLEFGLDH
jgi:hypothetical protein